MLLDPYMIKAIDGITSEQVYNSFVKLYKDIEPSKQEYIPSIELWLAKLRKLPGSALSTGRTNSLRGLYTCSLLDVLEVKNPRGARNRNQLAWDVLDSNWARNVIGYVEELEQAREQRKLPFNMERFLECQNLLREAKKS